MGRMKYLVEKKKLLFGLLSCCFYLVELYAFEAPTGFGVDFHQSMMQTNRYDKKIASQRSEWCLVESRYNDFIAHLNYLVAPRIPKVIHQIWLGSQLPEKERQLCLTWVRYNPEWEYKLWTDKDIDQLHLVNRALYDAASNYGEKSDIARCEILYRFGGLYVDTDFECFKPFDILHHCCDFYVGLNCVVDPLQVVNALIASAPGHPILKCYIESLAKNTKKYRNKGTLYTSGPFYFTECIMKMLPYCSPETVLFPTSYFYPWPFTHRHEQSINQIRSWIRPESFAMHHWHLSWAK